MTTLLRRLHRDEDGYSLVIAMLLLSIMMVLAGGVARCGKRRAASVRIVDRVEQVADGGRGRRQPIHHAPRPEPGRDEPVPASRRARSVRRWRPVPGELVDERRDGPLQLDRVLPDDGEPDLHARGAGDLRAGAVVQVRDLLADGLVGGQQHDGDRRHLLRRRCRPRQRRGGVWQHHLLRRRASPSATCRRSRRRTRPTAAPGKTREHLDRRDRRDHRREQRHHRGERDRVEPIVRRRAATSRRATRSRRLWR